MCKYCTKLLIVYGDIEQLDDVVGQVDKADVILTTVYYTENPVGEIKSRTSWNTIQTI